MTRYNHWPVQSVYFYESSKTYKKNMLTFFKDFSSAIFIKNWFFKSRIWNLSNLHLLKVFENNLSLSRIFVPLSFGLKKVRHQVTSSFYQSSSLCPNSFQYSLSDKRNPASKLEHCATQKIKLSIIDFFSKCKEILPGKLLLCSVSKK